MNNNPYVVAGIHQPSTLESMTKYVNKVSQCFQMLELQSINTTLSLPFKFDGTLYKGVQYLSAPPVYHKGHHSGLSQLPYHTRLHKNNS